MTPAPFLFAVSLLAPGAGEQRLSAGDQAPDDRLGVSVAIHGDTAVVGAFDDDNASGVDAGAAYVYERDGAGTWSEVAKLLASNGSAIDAFGSAVAIHADTIVVGAPSEGPGAFAAAGSAYVFGRDQGGPGAWGEVAVLSAADGVVGDRFGAAVSVAGDTAVVGALGHDLPGAVSAGAAYVFERDQGGIDAWGQSAKLTAADAEVEDFFGTSVAVDADTLLVGADFEDPLGVTRAGAAYVFERDLGGAGAWGQAAKLVASDPQNFAFFGQVSISGDTALVGAPQHDLPGTGNSGAAYVFERDLGGPGAWGQRIKLAPADPGTSDFFGRRVAVLGDRALIGADGARHKGGLNAGAAYLFERNRGTLWGQTRKLVSSDLEPGDFFGTSVSLSADAALVGAREDDDGTVVGDVEDLAFDPVRGILYGTDVEGDFLLTLDAATGTASFAGKLFSSQVRGLAFDPGAGVLYGSDTLSDQLLVIDTDTGAATAVGPFGFTSGENVNGLAFDPASGALFGTRRSLGNTSTVLITIDTATGAGTAVGPLGFTQVRGLTFDAAAGVLLGADDATNQLLVIDALTGAATAIGPLSFGGVRGLAWDPTSGALYGNDRATGALVDIDPATAAAVSIGPLSIGIPNTGAGYVFELAPGVAYCTAGVSASGCRAKLDTAGAPSASAGAGFDVLASGVEGGRGGLFFFGTGGRQANPWGNGTSFECVVPPVARGGLLAGSGTAGACDGSFAQDLNARWAAKPSQNPGPGALAQVQLWYRDPFNTSNRTTSLSDAVEVLVGP